MSAIDILAHSPFFNGLLYAAPLFLLWCSGADRGHLDMPRLLLTIAVATGVGTAGTLPLQYWIRWPAPGANPGLSCVYADSFREYFRVHPNPNSFLSDSAMLYAAVACGIGAWNQWLAVGLLGWLIVFVGPAKVFVGGHYPTDILAGVLLGSLSYWLSAAVIGQWLPATALNVGHSKALTIVLFCWLFEVGNEFLDVRHIVNGFLHARRRRRA